MRPQPLGPCDGADPVAAQAPGAQTPTAALCEPRGVLNGVGSMQLSAPRGTATGVGAFSLESFASVTVVLSASQGLRR